MITSSLFHVEGRGGEAPRFRSQKPGQINTSISATDRQEADERKAGDLAAGVCPMICPLNHAARPAENCWTEELMLMNPPR